MDEDLVMLIRDNWAGWVMVKVILVSNLSMVKLLAFVVVMAKDEVVIVDIGVLTGEIFKVTKLWAGINTLIWIWRLDEPFFVQTDENITDGLDVDVSKQVKAD